MQLKPGEKWLWYYDQQQDRLMLDLGEGLLFRSRYSRSQLIGEALQPCRFDVRDAASFHLFQDACAALALRAEQRAELVLNTLVARRFLKPLMPKSWHFAVQRQTVTQPQCGMQVQVQLLESGEWAALLIAEAGDNASLCLLAQPVVPLNGKPWRLGEAIKIMNDRLVVPQTSVLVQAS